MGQSVRLAYQVMLYLVNVLVLICHGYANDIFIQYRSCMTLRATAL